MSKSPRYTTLPAPSGATRPGDYVRLATKPAALESRIAHPPHDIAAQIELSTVMFQREHLRASSQPLLQAAIRLPRNAPHILH